MKDASAAITVSNFSTEDAPATFGLARLAVPDLTPGRWRKLVSRWTADRGAGALLARDAAERIVGLAPYETRSDLMSRRTLWVERVVAVSLVDSGPIMRALAAGLADIAHRHGCSRLKVETCVADRALRQALSRNVGSVRSTLVQAPV